MKRFLIFFLLFAFLLTGCSILTTSKGRPPSLKEARNLLKNYALCSCIKYITDDKKLKNDISRGIYSDISNYSDSKVFNEIDSLAKIAALTIEPSQIADYGYQKPLLLGCISFFQSKKLDSLVRIFDKIYTK